MRRIALLGLLAAPLVAGAAKAPQDDPTVLAQKRYEAAKAQGLDFSRGPCLGEIMPGWVADIAHQPRQPIDDQPENQCPAYRSGAAKHFVELDPDGKVIRSQ